MRVILVGNQNGGKSTVFNLLTHSHRRVGNYPGITVDCGVGVTDGGVEVVDLPGVYSLSPYTDEERVTRDFIESGDYDGIVNVVDAASLGRGLYLTLCLLRHLSPRVPVVVAVNMMDEVRRRKGSINASALRRMLGAQNVVFMSAADGDGVDELMSAIESLMPRERGRVDVDTCADAESVYREVDAICARCVRVPEPAEPVADKVILGKCAYLIFAAVMTLSFFVTFSVGGMLSRALGDIISRTSSYAGQSLSSLGVSPFASRLVAEGIFSGVGSVLGFFPSLLLLWTFMAVLEDSGYLSRVSFFADGIMSRLGLSGRCVVPLIFGFGCTVPAVLSSRAAGSDRARLRTIFAVPFMSCGAKLPVYMMMANAFFPGREYVYVFAMYAVGVFVAVIGCLLTSRRSVAADNVVELPPYRLPRPRVVTARVLSRAREFAVRACTVIFLVSVAVWLLSSVDAHFHVVANARDSLLADAGRLFARLLSPLGFGDWRAASALFAGLGAKEAIVGTLTVLTGGDISSVFTPASAAAFGVFVMLYAPCASALSAIASEAGARRAALCAVAHTLLAWFAAMIVWRLF